MMIKQRGFLGMALLALTACSFGYGDQATLTRILEEGKNRNRGYQTLTELCTKIGPRLTGSTHLERAKVWAMDKFKSYGLQNVHLEEWGTVEVGFERGPRQSVKLIAPYEAALTYTTPCWTVGTSGPVQGKLMVSPTTAAEAEAKKDDLKGAWILMPGTVGMRAADYRKPTELDLKIDTYGIAGRIYTTGVDLVWTGGTWRDYTDETRPKTPLIVVPKKDYDLMKFNVDKSRSPILEVNIENRFLRKPIPQHNVIAEIPGTEKPDEVVIVSGHLDSWNGPGSQGASDNGTGSSATIEAARILMASGAKPKRTIRFILWTGEEQGLLGSTSYVDKHKDELDKIMAVLVEDSGQNYHASIAGLPNMMEILQTSVGPMADAFPEMPVAAREVSRMSRSGSDHVPFLLKGVPAFFMGKGGNLSYRHVWHTQNDRPTEVPEANMRQMSTNLAVLSYNLSCSPEMMPRVALSSTVHDDHQVGGYFEDGDSFTCKCSEHLEIALQLQMKPFR